MLLMLFEFDSKYKKDTKYQIAVCGFRGCSPVDDPTRLIVRVANLCREEEANIQLFSADRVATHLHILVSALYAIKAFICSKSISKTIATESLLYASSQRQIAEAINRVGIRVGSTEVVALVVCSQPETATFLMDRIQGELGGERDDGVLGIHGYEKIESLESTFTIDRPELEATEGGLSTTNLELAIAMRVMSRIAVMALSK